MTATRPRRSTTTRKSLPLTEKDLRDLELLKEPNYRSSLETLTGLDAGEGEVSEAALLHAVFEAGIAAVREAADADAYAAIGAELAASKEERRAVARRRTPSWATEA